MPEKKSYKECAVENAARKQARKYPPKEPEAEEIIEEVELQPDDPELEQESKLSSEAATEETEGK